MRYAFFYEGGVRCDGHGFLRDDLDTVHLKISFPDHEVGCTTVKENNTGGVDFDNNPVTNPNCKHVDDRHHFPRARVASGEFKYYLRTPGRAACEFSHQNVC